MISSKTAKLARYSSLFIVALIFSPLDLAVTIAASIYFLINSKKIISIVGISILLLLIDILLQYFDISIRFISDLSLDAYILFITAAVLYMKTQKNLVEMFRKIRGKGKVIYWKHLLSVLMISLSLSLLAFPLVGVHIASIITYLSLSYLLKRFDGKYAYIIALFFLLFSPFFIILKNDPLSESFAIFSFYFMILGTIQEVIKLVGVKKYKIEKLLSGIKVDYKRESPKSELYFNRSNINQNFIHIKKSDIPKTSEKI